MARPIAVFVALTGLASTLSFQPTPKQNRIGGLQDGARFVSFESDGAKGVAVTAGGSASVEQSKPVQLEFYAGPGQIEQKATGYETFEASSGKAKGTAKVSGPSGSSFSFQDEWSVQGDVVELSRTVTVSGGSSSGFMSEIEFPHPETHPRSAVDYFAPGLIYGSTAHLTNAAIGGSLTYEADGHGQLRIREDRLPAPMFGVRFEDGSALTILDPAPDGETTGADSRDTGIETMVDEHFRFGAIGADLDGGHHSQGFWFPGSEGEVTYRGNTYPGGQVHEWRRRYHPIRDGLVQKYRVQFRFSKGEDFSKYLRNSWRWAYSTLKPPITWQDIPIVRRSIVDVLASEVQIRGDRAAIPNFVSAVENSDRPPNHQAIMGFTGKNLESAEFLLADALMDTDRNRAANDRKLGLAIFSWFIKLRMNPPVGEGFNIDTGEPALAIPRDRCVFLRSFGDDMKATLRAYRRERTSGAPHSEWLAWAQQFGDWLLTQQAADGGFPRSWKPVTGEVLDASPQSSYNPVPFLALLTQETRDPRYLHAAERAADFVWSHGQSSGKFVGGTIDNPDVLDKEAGTLSNEAYIALYEATQDSKWLARAQAAADYAETWIYLWNVPMPLDADGRLLHWKNGVPTYGTELISSGHSLVDEYMSFDVDEYAKLGRWAHDDHYLAVAKLLLHDTKSMLAVPGRTFDLKGPGWQQEHFSFAPVRGFGLHRLWLPWVATSQLNGIFGLMEFDPSLFQQWTAPESKGTK
ncbi:MAG: hypothetical protein M3Y72_13540 [Acidobacteriota bacterium]|nr:hypothetical protein [Acidobacteriota bacterium]